MVTSEKQPLHKFSDFNFVSFLYILFFIILGLIETYWLSIINDFKYLPGGYIDGTLNHYFFEHSWLWISGNKVHANFWDSPFFYPIKNVAAFSDTFLGCAPFYWLLRFIGLGMYKAYFCIPAIFGILNYLACYAMLKRCFKTSSFVGAAAAFLFAFNASRLFALIHIQLWPQFYTPLAIICIYNIYIYFNTNRKLVILNIFGAFAFIVLQLYAGWYLGWFLCFGLIIYFIFLLCRAKTRYQIITFICQYKYYVFFFTIISLVAIYPMFNHYYQAQLYQGRWFTWKNVLYYMPIWSTWINTPSILYSYFYDINAINCEHVFGIGIITLGCSLLGITYLFKRNQAFRPAIITFFIIFLFVSLVIAGLNFWYPIWKYFPGASGIRATSRIIFLFYILFCIGFSVLLARSKRYVKYLIILIMLMENLGYGSFQQAPAERHARVSMIAEAAASSQLPFIHVFKFDNIWDYWTKSLDTMVASLHANLPVINGHSGNEPHDFSQIQTDSVSTVLNSHYMHQVPKPFNLLKEEDGKITSQIITQEDFAESDVWTPDGEKTAQFYKVFPPMRLNRVYPCDEDSPKHFYLLEGWSKPEKWGVWSDSPNAILAMEVPDDAKFLNLTVQPYINGKLPSQQLNIYINKQLVMDVSLNKKETVTIPVPKKYQQISEGKQGKYMYVVLNMPNCASPQDMGESGDKRKLGIGLLNLEFTDEKTKE